VQRQTRDSRQPERTGAAEHGSRVIYSDGSRSQATPSRHNANGGLVRAAVNFRACELVIGKVIPVQAVEALRLREVEVSTFSDIRLTGGGKVVSPTRQLPFTPRKIPGTHFC
jgi:hypothetical protein